MDQGLDLITGLPWPDSDDEYIRQAAEAQLLARGFAREEVAVSPWTLLTHQGQPLRVHADLLVSLAGRPALVITCRRGSLVSREKETIAEARLLFPTWVPLAAVFNGDEGELLDTASGKVLASGPAALPHREELAALVRERPPHSPTPAETCQAARVYHAFYFIQCPGVCCV
ncbi:MAG: hypothetical protein KQJ78_21855 [Deltaproteobacteria bacterium]|nr:hypothetical protein [Deltaproteobacteria bacterium]